MLKQTFKLGGSSLYVVSSERMLSNLKVRDVVIIKNIDNANDDSAFDNLKVGDIIVFKSDDGTKATNIK